MKILAVASNGAVVKQGRKVELRRLESFMTAAQRRHLQANEEYERSIVAQVRQRLESRIQ
jgi:hypothetical protein